ncbi:MAG: hypothetical protein ACK4GN_16855, partial [Runella sp.]
VCGSNGTYSVAFAVSAGATVTASAGTVSGNSVIGIPIGSNLTLTADAGGNNCKVSAIVNAPTNCDQPCVNPSVSVSAPVCEANGTANTYSVNFVASPGATLSTNVGTVGSSTITGIPSGTALTITVKAPNCPDRTITVQPAVCPSKPCPKPRFSITTAPTCANDNGSYTVSVQITGKLGTVKTNVGTITGSNPYTISGIPNGVSLKLTDSLDAVCKHDTTIIGPNCNCTPRVPTVLTPSVTACIGDTFPTLRATVVGLAVAEWFTTPTGGSLVASGDSFKPTGTVPATGDTLYVQARSTDNACPTAVSPSRAMVIINAQNCSVEVDLALRKMISKKVAQIGDELTYTIKVFNQGNVPATGVEVTDSIASTVQFVAGSFTASRGSATISGNVIKWTIGNIAASPDTVTLTYKVKAVQMGQHFNTAEISKTNEKDKDSTPANGRDQEDDLDRVCFTVPMKLCPSEKIEVSIPSKYTGVRWFKNGQEITSLAGKNVVLLSELGEYTFTATNNTCPASGCCPIIIEAGDNCCPEQLCIPFTVKKTRVKK